VRRTRYSRKLVRQAVRGTRGDVFRVRQSSLDAYLPVLDAEWASGCHNGAELWRRLRDQSFQGSLRVVSEWTTRRRRADQMQAQGLQKAPSARTLARLMSMGRDHLSKAGTVTVAAVEAGVLGLATNPTDKPVTLNPGNRAILVAEAREFRSQVARLDPYLTAGLVMPEAWWSGSRP